MYTQYWPWPLFQVKLSLRIRYFAENYKFYLFIQKAIIDRGEHKQKHKQSCSLYIFGYKIFVYAQQQCVF